MRRVVSRTLMVLGGALATTAAAWAFSSASAAADSPLDLPSGGIERIDSVLPADSPVRVSDLTEAIGRILGEPDPAFGEQAKAAFDEVGRKITERFDVTTTTPPIERIDDVADVDIPSTTQPGDTADHGSAVGVVTAPIATATTLVGVRPGAIDQNTVAGAQERALSDGMSRRGSPETSDEAPTQPTSPLVPLSVPAPVGSGHTGSGSVDAPSFGLLSSVPSGTDLNTADAPRSAQVNLPAAVGAQPGVTPD
ncbi:hypothetical protein [Alloactinosynnema sp. L-07]|uniref:hypothetical protein n=1 Tax=Alloactinosynnema sp. L-07 TaxID=1653480 RepID=UPI0012FB1E9E|nr:hypothetical protein [Alloactinosynnema sp. L-07]